MRPESMLPAASWRHVRASLCIIRLVLCAGVVALACPIPSNAYSTYSLAIVKSDGSVVGDAITDGTPPPGTNMNHTAYATAKRTSPKGRKSVNNGQGRNTYRAEVVLPFDPTDTGTFLEASVHSVYCPCMGMFINCVGSQAQASVPTPAYVSVTGSSADSIQCGSSNFYARRLRITYRVLDAARTPIQIPGMAVQEALSWTSSTCATSDGCGQKPTASTWTTDSTGTITAPDSIYNCSSTCIQGGNCSEDWQQSFSVNSLPVGIINGSTTGMLNCIATSCSTIPQGTTH